MKFLSVVSVFFLIVGCASLQATEMQSCKDNAELVQDGLLDLELIENDIKYYSEIIALPKESRPKLRCSTCFEKDLEDAKTKKDLLLERIETLKKTNC